MASSDTLIDRFYQYLDPEEAAGRDPAQLHAAARNIAELAGSREPGDAAVQVLNPTMDTVGYSGRHTIVHAVTDDMPFLVDSVLGEVNRHGRTVHLLLHPQLVLDRQTGEILDLDPQDAGKEHQVESWIYLEIDRIPDAEDREALTQGLIKVLGDVRKACEDWSDMRQQIRGIMAELELHPPSTVDPNSVAPTVDFLRWLDDHHFTFLGYRSYELVEGESDSEAFLRSVAGSGLGILRDQEGEGTTLSPLTPEAAQTAREPRLLTVTKANSIATVHRMVPLDYIGIRQFDKDGIVYGEHRFLGLFTQSAYAEATNRLPIVGAKVREALADSGFAPDSHSGKDLVSVLENFPRDELFQAPASYLHMVSREVLRLEERPRARAFVRNDEFGRFVSVVVYLPRDRYNTANRLRVEKLLQRTFGGLSVDYATRVGDGPLAQLHFVIRIPRHIPVPVIDEEKLQQELADATRTWSEGLTDAVQAHLDDEGATGDLVARYRDSFPEAYKEDFDGATAYFDLGRLFELHEHPHSSVRPHLYRAAEESPVERRLKVYRSTELSLTDALPIFADFGLEVTDERPYELTIDPTRTRYIYDFGLRAQQESIWSGGPRADESATSAAFEEAFSRVWDGQVESDTLNSLVLSAGLDWRRVVILRTLVRYVRQVGAFSLEYLEEALVANPESAEVLIEMFAARFDPDLTGDRQAACAELDARFEAALDHVASLDQDRILRSYQQVLQATVRTNFYQRDDEGQNKPYVSLKVLPQELPLLPEPRPQYEIWVYSPRAEGSHLRFGAVARGGLRWSDRREDFRTEVLGLVKAQMVKNSVIVPTGSKGAYFAKQLPDPSERDAWRAEGVEAYKVFIRGMLDVTDNRLAGDIVPPPRVVRHDADDPYLVVAADKGTASFSDIANGVAREYGFWLDDAFASGGSAGYDHKAMAITARGGWESVKRHFRELGVNTQTEEFTVVGIGDMSGDVFGNGMLLSRTIRLVGAFDHRHIFLDPNPDAEASYAERERLFNLPGSSWEDYDSALISEGGGVWPRTTKAIPVSAQVRARLGLPAGVTSLSSAEMLSAILKAPADLLWNGGIGTYVKASTETHAEIGDRANDLIRVDGQDLRVRVVGEGGNLGMSQRGRVEAALKGIQVNTDAIDNSAGVDSSDQEVNIKIALTPLVQDGTMSMEERDALLVEMTDDVAHNVLRTNYEQNVLIGNGRTQREVMAPVHRRLISQLIDQAGLDPEMEFLPDELEWSKRDAAGVGLTSPEFAVLMAYSKLGLKEALIDTELPDDPSMIPTLLNYFPRALQERAEQQLLEHPLRREIIVNELANNMVNRGGVSFAFRAADETGGTLAQIARAFHVVRAVFNMGDYMARVESTDTVVDTDTQAELYLEFRRLIDRGSRWFLNNRPLAAGMQDEIDRFAEPVQRLIPLIGSLLQGGERARHDERVTWALERGVPEDVARTYAGLLDSFSLLDVVELALEMDRDVEEVAEIYFGVSEAFHLDELLTHVSELPRGDRWASLARGALRDDIYGVMRGLSRTIVDRTDPGSDSVKRVREWMVENEAALLRTSQLLRTVSGMEEPGLAPLSVALRTLRGLVRQGSAG